ncbi:MAG TPA: hypothetical protein VFE58_07775 [Tepidisphaeraceae bacterium]|jgi:hypothetical protein|nr:hypothetical protein [Tepidisphaeraceae bacterium]
MHVYPVIVLLVVVAGATVMFVWNVRRSTRQRVELELRRWARDHQFAVGFPVPEAAGGVLATCAIDQSIGNAACVFVRGRRGKGQSCRILIVRTDMDWPGSALRSVRAGDSIMDDLREFRAYPALPGGERFVTLGTTIRAGKILANSSLRTLLPPDLSVLLQGPWLLLDFSSRPFDTLEFSRLLPLANQLVGHLPAYSAAAVK